MALVESHEYIAVWLKGVTSMPKMLATTALSFLILTWATPAGSKPANKSAVIKVLQVTSERVCVPQVPGELNSTVLCGEGYRVIAESKEFYIEAVMLAPVMRFSLSLPLVHILLP
jgi:hypothetical protein